MKSSAYLWKEIANKDLQPKDLVDLLLERVMMWLKENYYG